jgi:hypothetical protein
MLYGVRPLQSLALAVALAALGCHAQTGAPIVEPGVKLSPDLARRVEVMIRSRSDVSADYVIAVGEPTKSDVPGYAQIVVTFTGDGRTRSPPPAVPRAADRPMRPCLSSASMTSSVLSVRR